MKKLLALLLALMMCVSVAACGAKEKEAPAEEKPTVEEPVEEEPVEEEPVAEDTAKEKEATNKLADKLAEDIAPAASASEMDMGSWKGNVYTNQWLDLSLTIPDGWYPLTSDQIASVLGAGLDVVSDSLQGDKDSMSAQISETDTYLFYVQSANQAGTAFLDMYDREAGKVPNMTPEEYLTQMVALLKSVDAYTIEADDIESGDGEAMVTVTMSADNGYRAYQVYEVVEWDQYLAVFFFSATDDKSIDEVSQLIDSISGIDGAPSDTGDAPQVSTPGEAPVPAGDADISSAVNAPDTSETSPVPMGQWIKTARYATEDKTYHTIYVRITKVTTSTEDSAYVDSAIALHNSIAYDFQQIDLEEWELPDDVEACIVDYEVFVPEDFPAPDYGMVTPDVSLSEVNIGGGGFPAADGKSTYIGLGTNHEELETEKDPTYMPGNVYALRDMFTMVKGYENYVFEFTSYPEGTVELTAEDLYYAFMDHK